MAALINARACLRHVLRQSLKVHEHPQNFSSINLARRQTNTRLYGGVCNIYRAASGANQNVLSSNLFDSSEFHIRACHSQSQATQENQEKEVDVEGEKVEDGDGKEQEEFRSLIENTEHDHGETSTHEFQAETRMLLDIVAKSLYSDKEVFIRELISNASDAVEKLRYIRLSSDAAAEGHAQDDQVDVQQRREIHISTDKSARTFTIQDTGVGMTRDEMIDNLGTIAKSGAKSFLKEMKERGVLENQATQIIGQFGVGFYSTFMVADKVDVYSISARVEGRPHIGHHWSSDGSGKYDIVESDGVQPGTKIILHLKSECENFSIEDKVEEIIKKHSNFVNVPVYLNGRKINTIAAVWTMDSKDVSDQMHTEFYRFISHMYDSPRYTLHYKADVPLSIQALFYVPDTKPGIFDLSQFSESGIQLYSRKILIQSKADILPNYLRFVKGVVDSEDIPLNLSRELLQDSHLLRRLKTVLTNRLLRYFQEQARKDRVKYEQFYGDYGQFFREGIVTTADQREKEEIAKLLRFESSKLKPGQLLGLADYVGKMSGGQKEVYYLSAPSRSVAETSPYYEALSSRDLEILFCYQPYDELMLLQLQEFMGHKLKSAEKIVRDEREGEDAEVYGEDSLGKEKSQELVRWIKQELGHRVKDVRVTAKLSSHPCLVTVEDMAAARHFVRTQLSGLAEETRLGVLQPTLQVNPSHPIIKSLYELRGERDGGKLARLCIEQLYDNAMVVAGLVDDPRTIMGRMNELLTLALSRSSK